MPVITAVLAAACFGAPHAERAAAPTAEPLVADLTIAPTEGEVWSWTTEVAGDRIAAADRAGVSAFTSCVVVAESVTTPARLDGAGYRAQLRLRPGSNRMHAECTDARGAKHASPPATLRAMLRDGPTARITAERRGDLIRFDGSASTPSDGTSSPLVAFSWTEEHDGHVVTAGEGETVTQPLPHRLNARSTVRLTVRDALDRSDVSAARVRIDGDQVTLLDAASGGAPDAGDDVVYGVLPVLFGDPPLRAVTSALVDLADLGITALWLAPVFAAAQGDYGYAVTDFFRVRPDYGSDDDLRDLVREAHRLGLRVLLDLPANDTSSQHPYFRDASAHGRASHYFSFFERDAAGKPVHYFDWTNLPNLAYANDEVGRWMLAVTEYWLGRFDVDGFRLDAAWGIRERAPTFWDAWRSDVRRIAPDALLIAEASARDPFYAEHGFDAAYDWSDTLGESAWQHAFDDRDTIADRLDASVRAARVRPLRFLENNDTGARFVTRYGPGLTRAAAAALLTLPGIPSLFTGQERGKQYEPYVDHAPLGRDDPLGMRPYYRKLLSIRRATPALRGRGYERLRVDPEDRASLGDGKSGRVLAYVRKGAGARDVAIVAVHFDESTTRVRIVAGAGIEKGTGRWRDLVTGQPMAARNGVLSIELPPWGSCVLVPAYE